MQKLYFNISRHRTSVYNVTNYILYNMSIVSLSTYLHTHNYAHTQTFYIVIVSISIYVYIYILIKVLIDHNNYYRNKFIHKKQNDTGQGQHFASCIQHLCRQNATRRIQVYAKTIQVLAVASRMSRQMWRSTKIHRQFLELLRQVYEYTFIVYTWMAIKCRRGGRDETR